MACTRRCKGVLLVSSYYLYPSSVDRSLMHGVVTANQEALFGDVFPLMIDMSHISLPQQTDISMYGSI